MALKEVLARFGFQVDKRNLDQADKSITGVIGKFRAFGAVIAGSAVVGGIKSFISEITIAGDSIGKTATQLGLSNSELQAWQTAAGFAGVEAGALNKSFRALGISALAAQNGSKEMAASYKELGVEIEQSNGQLKPASQLAREAGVALGALEDRTKAVGMAQRIFGLAGAKLLPLFTQGAQGLDSALASLDRFGGGLSDELIPLTEASRDRFFELEIATTSLKSQVAVALLPTLNYLTLGLSRGVAWLSRATEGGSALKAVMIALGAAIVKVAVAKFGSQLMMLGRAAIVPLLKFALLVAVIDDLIALFEGRGSVIGTFIDKIFGAGSATAVVKGVKDVAGAFSDFASTGDIKKLNDQLDDVFGPPGQALVEGTINIVNAMADAIGAFIVEGTRDLAQWGRDLGREITNMITLMGDRAKDLGKAIVDGITSAIVGGSAKIVKSLVDGVSGAIKGAKKFIKSNSPSRKTSDEIGKPLIQGIPVGAIKEAPKAAAMTLKAIRTATALGSPSKVSKAAKPVSRAGGALASASGGVIFQSDIKISVQGSGGDVVGRMRTSLRDTLRENRDAIKNALTQRVQA